MLRLWHPVCKSSEEAAALTAKLTFPTSLIHRPAVRSRGRGPIPSPFEVAAIFGGLLNVERDYLLEFACKEGILTGASLLDHEGSVSAWKVGVDRGNSWRGTILRNPTYKLALASPNHALVDELVDRLEGWRKGLGDRWASHFIPPKSVSDVRRAALSMETVAEGYCRLEHLRSVRGDEIVLLEFRQEGKMIEYVGVFKGVLIVEEALPAANDGESKLFLHRAWEFLE